VTDRSSGTSSIPSSVSSYDDVVAAFDDPSLIVPAVVPSDPLSSLDWLRTSVSRFTNGDDHARRRALVEADLARLQPGALRDAARQMTAAEIEKAPNRFDLMAAVAVVVPTTVLASALGVDASAGPAVVRAVGHVAAGYRDPDVASVRSAADAAVDELVEIFGGEQSEVVANRAGLLVQGFDATAGLIGNAAAIALRMPAGSARAIPVETFIAEVLRFDPPVRATRRANAGAPVVLDLAAANRDANQFPDPHRFEPGRSSSSLTFGAGPRRCPGESLAVAIAAGALEAIIERCELADPDVPIRPSPNLSVPLRLDVARRPT